MRKKKKNQRIDAFIALFIVLSAIGAAVFVAAPWRAGDYDVATFCPKDGQYPRTVLLIDATDSLEESQNKTLGDLVNDLRRGFQPYEWVGVYVLNEENITVPQVEIALCNPGSGEDANPLYQNPREINRQYNQKFAGPIKDALQKLAQAPRQPSSPIMEMIQAVASDNDFDASQKRRLIIVSDMLQHTGDYSHYRHGVDYDEWLKGEHAAELIGLSLSGVDVEIWYVKRQQPQYKGLQTRRHVRFWEKFFEDAGANVTNLKPF